MTDKPESVLGDLPEGVASAMFLRDGWPNAVVCKVLMKNGCVGIGVSRFRSWIKRPVVAEADAAALSNAIANVSDAPPDYTEVIEHMAKMKALVDRRLVFDKVRRTITCGGEPLGIGIEDTPLA